MVVKKNYCLQKWDNIIIAKLQILVVPQYVAVYILIPPDRDATAMENNNNSDIFSSSWRFVWKNAQISVGESTFQLALSNELAVVLSQPIISMRCDTRVTASCGT